MTSIPYYISTSKLTIIDGGKPVVIDVSHPDYDAIKQSLLNSDWVDVRGLLNNPTPTHQFTFNGNEVSIEADEIMYNGEPLQHGFVERLQQMRREGLKDPTPWLKFLERVMQNPSQRIRDTLHTFVEDQHMALTEEGKILAYKGVRNDLYDQYSGTIYNGIGDTITIPRADVDDNAEHTCSNGLHVGDYEYARSYGSSGTLLLVEFCPSKAVSVPIDGQKLRTCEYKVIKSIRHDQPLKDPLYQIDDANQVHPMSSQHPSWNNAKAHLQNYLEHYTSGCSLTVDQLCEEFAGLSQRDAGRLTSELEAHLKWEASLNDYTILPSPTFTNGW